MNKNRIDYSGKKFGRLIIISPSISDKHGHTKWNCICECGNTIIVRTLLLTGGTTKSCGCYRKEIVSNMFATHRKISSRAYRSWGSMKARCFNKFDKWYCRYGGRGITVCKRWMKFENFYLDMGERPLGKSLDRINNNGNYEPANCRWATKTEQMGNKSNNVIYELNGIKDCVSGWSRRLGIKRETLQSRIVRGWSLIDLLTKKIGEHRNLHMAY